MLDYNRIGWELDSLADKNGTTLKSENAPLTRVLWQCANLPAGLELSESGELSGRPTITGTYDCNVSVTTNWGTATKTVRIRVTE